MEREEQTGSLELEGGWLTGISNMQKRAGRRQLSCFRLARRRYGGQEKGRGWGTGKRNALDIRPCCCTLFSGRRGLALVAIYIFGAGTEMLGVTFAALDL